MKWLLKWELEGDREIRVKKEAWANSWEEVVGYFTEWIAKSSDVIKGEVICYLGETPYGNGKPCLYFNVFSDEIEEEE